MFKQLRLNSQIYIFKKNNDPVVEIGQITNFPIAKPKYNVPPQFNLLQEMIVDLVVKVGDQLFNYNLLPADGDISDTFSNGENIVIADNREAINAEIITYKLLHADKIKNIPISEKIILKCDQLLNDLNPEYAEKVQLLEELSTLKLLMSEMTKSLTALTELVGQLTRKENNNELNVGNLRT